MKTFNGMLRIEPGISLHAKPMLCHRATALPLGLAIFSEQDAGLSGPFVIES